MIAIPSRNCAKTKRFRLRSFPCFLTTPSNGSSPRLGAQLAALTYLVYVPDQVYFSLDLHFCRGMP